MKNKNILLVISALLISSLCSVCLYSSFMPPTNTPCMPIGYPEGKKIDAGQGKIYTFESIDAYHHIIAFYRANLKFDPPIEDRNGPIVWKEYPIRNIGVLFECGSSLNYYESELSCIFIHNKEGGVTIDIIWSYNQGPGIPCYVLPEIEPEDYLITLDDVP